MIFPANLPENVFRQALQFSETARLKSMAMISPRLGST